MFGLQTNEIRDRIGLVGEEALNQVLVTRPTITEYGSSAAPTNLPHSHDSYKNNGFSYAVSCVKLHVFKPCI